VLYHPAPCELREACSLSYAVILFNGTASEFAKKAAIEALMALSGKEP
jgi:hypothetical protein